MYHPVSHQLPKLNERDSVQYLIGNPPSWMMRYGIVVIAVLLLLLLILSWIIRFPDTIEAKTTLTTINPPVRVMAASTGRVTHLFVHSGDSVYIGQPLAIIDYVVLAV